MKIEMLFYAIEIADTGSFSQAARNLYVSQPNLSHAIRQLEEQYQVTLFHRTSLGVVPTPEGQVLIERARIIKREYEQTKEILRSPIATKMSLRVATLNCSRVNSAFSDITERYAATPMRFSFLNYTSMDELIAVVEKGQVDFAIIGILSPYKKAIIAKLNNASIEYHALSDVSICALVGAKNPLFSGKDTVKIEELYPYAVVQYGNTEDNPSNSLPYEAGLSRHAFGEIHVTSSQLFYSVIRNSTAVGLVTSKKAAPNGANTHEGIKTLQISNCDMNGQFAWIKLRRFPLSDIASESLQMISQYF